MNRLRFSSTLSRIPTIMSQANWKPRYFDIGVNFSDGMFQGHYNGSSTKKHEPDLHQVVERAQLFNVNKMLITASSIKESEDHFKLCEEYPGVFTSTVGVHPCTVAQEFYVHDGSSYTEELVPDINDRLDNLKNIVQQGHLKGCVKAFGEIGLDYDRLHYSTKNQQLTMFKKQLEVIASLKELKLPLFLHMRSACDDFVSIIKPFLENGSISEGVVHSFTGSEEELQKLLALGFYIGINGCSLKTDENLKVASLVPPAKLMIETDAPWCEIRKSHSSYKFITAYPNKFYPQVEADTVEENVSSGVGTPRESDSESVKELKLKKKKQQQQKKPEIKLDDFLPIPTIKKENFQKHCDAIGKLLEVHPSPDSIDFKTGTFAYPLMKSRNEPVFIGYVAQIMCHLYGYTEESQIEELIDLVYDNSDKLFGKTLK